MRSRPLDLVFVAFFALFFVGWLVFDMPVALGIIDPAEGWYAREVDPIFQDPPLWLETVGWFAFVYGPAYAAAAYGFARDRSWIPYVLLPLAGAITATTTIYFVEELVGDVRPLNMAIFYALNLPYLVIPPLAAVWSVLRRRAIPGAA